MAGFSVRLLCFAVVLAKWRRLVRAARIEAD